MSELPGFEVAVQCSWCEIKITDEVFVMLNPFTGDNLQFHSRKCMIEWGKTIGMDIEALTAPNPTGEQN